MKYSSNIQDAVYQLQLKIELAKKLPLQEIAMYLANDNSYRIHNEGKDLNNVRIGSYDVERELYVNPKNSPKGFKPMGKNGIQASKAVYSTKTKRKSKTQSSHKTKWFPNYKSFRNTIGRRIDAVNLSLSGKLSKEFQMVKVGNNAYNIGFLTAYGTKVAAGQEKHWSRKIWGVSKENEKVIAEIVNNHINQTFA